MCFTYHSWRNVCGSLMKLWKLKDFPSSPIYRILSILSRSWMKKKEWLETVWWSSIKFSGKITRRTKQRGSKKVIFWSIIPTFFLVHWGSCLHWNVFLISFFTLGIWNLGTRFCLWGGRFVTLSVLHCKSFAKTCHEYHVYVLMHVT